MASNPVLARLMLVACAVLFSTGGAAIKACALSGWQVACVRSAIAAAALLVLLPESRRRPTVRAALVAVAYAATLVLFVRATKLTTAASAIFLQSSAPLYLLVLGPWLLAERVHRRDLLFVAALAAGLVLLIGGVDPPQASAPDPVLGNRLAAVSGVTWALTIVGLRHAARDDSGGAASAVVIGNALAALVCLPFALPLPSPNAADVAVLLYLGVFQIGLAYFLLTRGIRHVPALEASLLLLIEPVLNPLWAWAVQGEVPAAAALAGGALILVTTGLLTARRAVSAGPPATPASLE
jgi:drug/metabolite transporter (DMT)-like permease